MIPGEIVPAPGPVEIHSQGTPERLTITNKGAIPVHLTAHFHLMEANRRLCFDRRKAFGMRLATHAKGAIRIEPDETQQVAIAPIEGGRRIFGFSGAIDGPLDTTDVETALQWLTERGYCHRDEDAN